jgi:UDP-N-acetylglucosamine--N-acetylmuramyl-(pentapeptide) pyrophosphoryl-undecaprenol N-acetylglucosamine transferase
VSLRGVIFAGGGTGGHIFPAIAIAEQLASPSPVSNGGGARVLEGRRGSGHPSATDQSSGQCSHSPPPFPTGEGAESSRPEGVRCHDSPLTAQSCPPTPEHRLETGATDLPTAYLCSTRPIDRAILEPRNCDFTPIPATPFSPKPKAFIRFIRSWPKAVAACRDAIRTHCTAWNIEPNQCALVATGGFVCAPAATAARQLGLRVILVNLDAVPGKAARLLARKADEIYTTYPAFDLDPVGPIVRNQARAPAPPEQCRQQLGLDPNKPTLVISGASQGATSINAFILALIRESPEIFEGWQILHQAGPDRVQAVEAEYRTLPVSAKVVGLVDEVGLMWGAATLALARSGAGTVAELWANSVPTLFMPYPYHRDEHQRHNARPMVDAGLATILDDHIDPVCNINAHAEFIAKRLSTPKTLNFSKISAPPANGASEIATHLRNK